MDVKFHSEIGTPHTMIKSWIMSRCCWNRQEDQNISFSRWWVRWNHGPGSHYRSIWQSTSNEGDWCLDGKVTQPINFKATIMSLTLRYPSIDHLQTNWLPTLRMAHHSLGMAHHRYSGGSCLTKQHNPFLRQKFPKFTVFFPKWAWFFPRAL